MSHDDPRGRQTSVDRRAHPLPAPGGLPGPQTASRFYLLLGLAFLYYAIHEHPQFQPLERELSAPVPLLPIPIVVWHTGGWLLFAVLLWMLCRSGREWPAPADDIALRRSAVATLALVFGIELLGRLATVGFFGIERRVGVGGLLTAALLGFLVLAALLRWPPVTPVLTLLMLAGGLVLRLAWLFLVPQDPKHTDNMFVIRLGLERFLAGETPYAYFDFGTHTNPMPYLPWTFLSYLPPFLLGVDIRVTSIVLSLALVLVLWRLVHTLPMKSTARSGLVLTLGVLYALPLTVSLDLATEFAMFNVMLILTFVLIVLRRLRLASAAYGLALGSMPLALFSIVPLFCFLARARPWGESLRLVAIVCLAAGVPILAFLLWDAPAFLWAVSYVPREAWKAMDSGALNPTFMPIVWHRLGGWLRIVQGAWLVLFAALAWRYLRTIHGLVVLAAAGHLALALSGPYVAPHLVQVVLFLAVLAEATRAAKLGDLPSAA